MKRNSLLELTTKSSKKNTDKFVPLVFFFELFVVNSPYLLDGRNYDNLSGQQAYKCFACRVRKA
jgi:hypothetical protein